MKIHIISNTHWDREWRFSLEETRLRLVEMFDKLLGLFENDPDYKFFHLDSQTLPLEDYLEVRPEKRSELEELVKEGKLLVGPWFVLPDEFMVTGESLVRNLVIGHGVAEEFGKVMKVGYNPFSFCGQITQIAQIYRGFDIDTILFYRGIGDEGNGKDFYLEAPDGSRILNIRLTDWARANFLYFVFRGLVFGKEHTKVVTYSADEKGRPARVCLDELESRDLNMLNPPYGWHEDLLKRRFEDFIERMKAPASTDQLIGMDGYDSSFPSEFTTRIIAEAKKELELDIEHSSLPALAKAIKRRAKNLEVVSKEMRCVKNTYIGALSTRFYIKQGNRNAEFAIQKIAEPFAILAWMHGKAYPSSSLLSAWKAMLANQSHDSIGGCSADKVHRDMEQRTRKAVEIAKGLTRRSLYHIARRIDVSRLNEQDIAVTVFNPLPFKRDELVTAHVVVPDEWAYAGAAIYDIRGDLLESVVEPGDNWTACIEKAGLDVHTFIETKMWRVTFNARGIPAMGWKTFRVAAAKPRKAGRTGRPTRMENEFLKVSIKPNGSMDVLDKRSGRTMKGIHYFEDSGECGGPWNRAEPDDNPVYTTKKAQARVKVIAENSLYSARQIRIPFRIPVGITQDEKARQKRTRVLPIRTTVSLRKDSDQLEFNTEIDNNVESHRLRVMMPSGLTKAKSAVAEGQFDVVERPIRSPKPSEYGFGRFDFNPWNRQAPLTTHPQLSFLDVSDGTNGVGVLNFAMCEYEVCNDRERTIALTLLRTFPKLRMIHTLMDAHEGQCLGKASFRYALVPHKGTWENEILHERAQCFNVPGAVIQCYPDGEKGTLKPTAPGMEITGVVVDAIKKTEKRDSIVVRAHNPHAKAAKMRLKTTMTIKKAYLCNMNEQQRGSVTLKSKSSLYIRVPAKKVVTIEIVL